MSCSGLSRLAYAVVSAMFRHHTPKNDPRYDMILRSCYAVCGYLKPLLQQKIGKRCMLQAAKKQCTRHESQMQYLIRGTVGATVGWVSPCFPAVCCVGSFVVRAGLQHRSHPFSLFLIADAGRCEHVLQVKQRRRCGILRNGNLRYEY